MSKLRKRCLYKGALMLSVLVAAIFILSCKTTHAATRTQAEAIQWVKSQLNKQIDMDGYPPEQPYQCVDLIKAYYQFLGVSPVSGNGSDYTHNNLPAGAGWSRIKGAVPQPGDILVYTGGYMNYGHVAIYESEYSSYHQNFGGKTCVCHVIYRYNYTFYSVDNKGNKYPTPYWGVIRPSWNNGNNPQGVFDSVSGGNGYIDVRGWAFDKDSSGQSISVHVYIGGPAGSGARSYALTANKQRDDVNKAYNISGNHGFSDRLYTDKTGNQTVYVYAINIGGGQNVEIGHKTVNIQAASKPVISDVKIVEQDSQGYVVQCKVSSESPIDRVQFPTWTTRNNQDDLTANWGTNSAASGYVYGDYYRFRVNTSAHNNEYGTYVTDIYAYDKSGNQSRNVGRISTIVSMGAMPQQIEKYENMLLSVFEENLTWEKMNQFAEKMGSSLASIPDAEKQKVLYGMIKDRFRSYYSVGGFTTSKGGPWIWVTGDKFNYFQWDEKQPDCAGGTELYLSIVTKNGNWNDLPPTYTNNGFIMQTPLSIEPDAVIETNEKEYCFYNKWMPYSLAKRFCEEKGGYLACIGTKEENELLAAKIAELKHDYFIGLSDEETEGTFRWVTGEPIEYQNWRKNEPNNDIPTRGGEDYVELYQDGTWNDACGQLDGVGFIMEIDKKKPTPTPVPEPTPTPAPAPTPVPQPSLVPSSTPGSTDKPDELIYGDADKNGIIEASDALQVLKFEVGLEAPDDYQIKVSDVDGDNEISSQDALLILQKVVNIIEKFPI